MFIKIDKDYLMLISREDYKRLRKERKIKTLNYGSQTLAYLCKSDILIYVGERGTGKTQLILFKLLKYINTPNYNGVIFRKEYGDAEKAGGIVDASKRIFSQFGDYMTSTKKWIFNSNAKIEFLNYSDPIKDFRENIQGKEYITACVDETTQIDEKHYDAIFSNLRNTLGLPTQFIGTCNADSSSWIKDLVAKYLDINHEQHTARHAQALKGRELYFFQYGNNIKEAVWGLSKQEVYDNCRSKIDSIWQSMIDNNPKLADYGSIYDLILSISVFDSSKFENENLMASGGVKYQAKLLKNDAEMKNRYAITDWANTYDVQSLVTNRDMENFFYNSPRKTGERFASMDVGGEGNDKSIIYIWDGFHIENVYFNKSKTAKELIAWAKRIITAENIPMNHFVYDSGGLGFAFSGYFDGAMKFLSQAKQTDITDYEGNNIKIYANFKSQCVGAFLRYFKGSNGDDNCEVSIDPRLLDIDIYGQTLRQHLLNEKQAICWTKSKEGILQTISKQETIAVVGHSADIMLALVYRFAFNVDEQTQYEQATDDTFNVLQNFLVI